MEIKMEAKIETEDWVETVDEVRIGREEWVLDD